MDGFSSEVGRGGPEEREVLSLGRDESRIGGGQRGDGRCVPRAERHGYGAAGRVGDDALKDVWAIYPDITGAASRR